MSQETARLRCEWARKGSPAEIQYHDSEWGVPSHDDQHLFEMLLLEGVQAGLSWAIVLKKRPGYRRVFRAFDAVAIADWSQREIETALGDPDIIRNRGKLQAAVTNARCFLEVKEQFGTFSCYLWDFVDGRPRQNAWRHHRDVPAFTSESTALARDLRGRGFKFVGPTICYAFMQAVGLVNDHTVDCFRHRECQLLGG